MPLLDELVHDSTLVMDIHEDQNIGHQMPILDDLALLVARNGVLADFVEGSLYKFSDTDRLRLSHCQTNRMVLGHIFHYPYIHLSQ
jgi:hypothetical protein